MEEKLSLDPSMVADIARRLATGDHFIAKLGMYFVVVDGEYEDVVVGEELRHAVQMLAGVPLEEFVPRKYPGDIGLRFPPRWRRQAKATLDAAGCS